MTFNEKKIEAFNPKYGWITQVLNYYNPRNKYHKNEIRIYESGICEIDVYNSFGKYKDTGIFSEEDLDQIKQYKWYKDNTGYLSTTINGEKVRMHRLLFPNELSDHKNNNKLDNTRENLQQISQALNIAKITKKMSNPNGVTGIYFTPSQTFQAYIEVNKKRYSKNYKTKEEAILQRYIWELNFWKDNAPQLDDIKEKYPLLYKAMKNNLTIKDDVHYVIKFMNHFAKSPFCPCQLEKTERTKCICLNFLENSDEWCHCGLYRKVKD